MLVLWFIDIIPVDVVMTDDDELKGRPVDDDIGIICGTKNVILWSEFVSAKPQSYSLDVGVIVVKGDGTWGVYGTGDKWLGCDAGGEDDELLPVWCSMFESIKFFVFLFLRWVVPFEPMRYSENLFVNVERKFSFWDLTSSAVGWAFRLLGRGSVAILHALRLTFSRLKAKQFIIRLSKTSRVSFYLDLFFLHRDWAIDVVQFVVKSAGIAHRLALSVPTPEWCVYSITVWTFKAGAAGRRLSNEENHVKA